MALIDHLLSTAGLVHIALMFYCAGLMVRDELLLRILILIGTGFYLSYYFYFPETPLWDAMFASAAIGTVNLTLIAIVIRERTTFTMSAEDAALFKRFGVLTPGQFRKLMRRAEWRSASEHVELTRVGERPEELYFIVSGDIHLEKFGESYILDADKFIGEIAFLEGEQASATTAITSGARYVSWNVDDLHLLFGKFRHLGQAVVTLLGQDLSRKVASSRPTIRQKSE